LPIGLQPKQQSTLPRFIADTQQIVSLAKGSRRARFCQRRLGLRASDQHTPPGVKRRVAQGSEHGFVAGRVHHAWAQLEGRLQRKALGMLEPLLAVGKAGAFPALLAAGS
jgi:hypothetical protein